jgi:hypothetical protein
MITNANPVLVRFGTVAEIPQSERYGVITPDNKSEHGNKIRFFRSHVTSAYANSPDIKFQNKDRVDLRPGDRVAFVLKSQGKIRCCALLTNYQEALGKVTQTAPDELSAATGSAQEDRNSPFVATKSDEKSEEEELLALAASVGGKNTYANKREFGVVRLFRK